MVNAMAGLKVNKTYLARVSSIWMFTLHVGERQKTLRIRCNVSLSGNLKQSYYIRQWAHQYNNFFSSLPSSIIFKNNTLFTWFTFGAGPRIFEGSDLDQ